MRPRRWDDDSRGHGVASARGSAAPVRRLLEAMHWSDWVAEDPEVHLLPHLVAALGRPDSPMRLLGTRTDADGRFVVDLEWTGPAPARRQRAAIFALVGAIAESATTVHEEPREDGATFEVVTGLLEGDGPFASHGHTLMLRVLSHARSSDLPAQR